MRARQAAIARASEVMGGLDGLSARIGVSRPSLRAMLEGRIGVPQRLFFELIDIISNEAQPKDAAERPPVKRV
jgi:DNA-binding transcriptional regulator YdaS (Cro superfamily)